MVSDTIVPIILCGGSGVRLWPLSQPDLPKQFLAISGSHTLLQKTVLRCASSVFNARPIIVTSARHESELRRELLQIDVEADIVLEPEARDSAAAILAGCLRAKERDDNALVLAMAADHDIPDERAFCATAFAARFLADMGNIVTFGVPPTSASSAFGYIVPGAPFGVEQAWRVGHFIEKPTESFALQLISVNALWNSGNFLFRMDTVLAEFARYQPAMLATLVQAHNQATRGADWILLDPPTFHDCQKLPFDRAIMEHTTHAAVVKIDYAWSDVGSWDSVAKSAPADDHGNTIIGPGSVHGSNNVYIHASNRRTAVVGCDDLIVVVTEDAVLVTRKGAGEELRALVPQLSNTH